MSCREFHVIVLDGSDIDFEIAQMAVRQNPREIRLERFSRAEPLLEKLRGNTLQAPDLFLFDLRLPGESGAVVLDVIKTSEKYRHIPTIIWSTSSNPKDLANCYRTHANAYHLKPIETPEMINLLENVISYWMDRVELCDKSQVHLHD